MLMGDDHDDDDNDDDDDDDDDSNEVEDRLERSSDVLNEFKVDILSLEDGPAARIIL